MGRESYNQAVVKAYDEAGMFICEEILAKAEFDTNGSDLLISKERRVKIGIRFISVRSFDASGKRLSDWRLRYERDGALMSQNT